MTMQGTARLALALAASLGLGVASTPASASAVAVAMPRPAPAPPQGAPTMTAADVQRLQDSVYDLSGEISRLRGRDPSLANRLDDELSDLRDEVIYLKVKLRKEPSVSRSEYADLRDRIDALRTRARGGDASSAPAASPSSAPPSSGSTAAAAPPPPSSATAPPPAAGTSTARSATPASAPPPPPAGEVEADRPPASSTSSSSAMRARGAKDIPVGTELDVRLQSPLSSGTAQVEDRFEATTLVDLIEDGQLVVPAGSVMRGVVRAVNKAGRLDRKGSMTLSFDELTVRGRTYPIRATVTQAIESEGVRGEAGKIGTGAGVGAIIGGILGGFKGALAGILIGGGGTVAATEGKDVTLDAGTVLRVRFDSPVSVGGTSAPPAGR